MHNREFAKAARCVYSLFPESFLVLLNSHLESSAVIAVIAVFVLKRMSADGIVARASSGA